MASGNEQLKGAVEGEERRKAGTEELPMESSPYVNYSDLEDYKRQGYGTEGHLDVVDRQPGGGGGGGGTDAPTMSGSGLTSEQVRAADEAAKRKAASK